MPVEGSTTLGTTFLWVVLLIGISCVSPEVVDILAKAVAQASGFGAQICRSFVAIATVFGSGIFFALTFPRPGTFSRRIERNEKRN